MALHRRDLGDNCLSTSICGGESDVLRSYLFWYWNASHSGLADEHVLTIGRIRLLGESGILTDGRQELLKVQAIASSHKGQQKPKSYYKLLQETAERMS
jgi:hypothetical protein